MRNRDPRGRFIKNTKPQKEKETSTQRAIETEAEILGEETVEQNPEPGNTIHQQTHNLDDPALDDTVDPERIHHLLTNPNSVVSQIAATAVILKDIGPSKRPIGDKTSDKKNPERWDFTPSPKKDRIVYTILGNPFTMGERRGNIHEELHIENEGEGQAENEVASETTFGFPILDVVQNVTMKNIPLSALPTFHGKHSEDPDVFLFEFDILCRSYNYLQDAHKLKLFPATLKDSALRWFMSLGEYSIRSWEDMKTKFLKKYQDYCRTKDSRNDIFKLQQQDEESLEDFLERFIFTLQKSKYTDLQEEAIKTLFLKGVLEEYIDTLNLMAAGDIYQKNFETICELCRTYSRSRGKAAKSVRESVNRNTKTSTSGGVTRVELGNLLENFKTDLLGTIGSQLDTLKIKKKQEEENPVLSIFCSKCRKRHPLRECPLDNVSVCAICAENHKTEDCPSLPGLQAIFKGGEAPGTQSAPKKPWQPRNPNANAYQEPPPQSSSYYPPFSQQQQHQWNWPNWPPQNVPAQPWYQGWRNPNFGNNHQQHAVPVPQNPYTQYPPNLQQLLPGFTPPPLQQLLPGFTPPSLPPIPQNPQQSQNPPRPTILPAQPIPNPNHRPPLPLHNADFQNYPAYNINPISIQEVQLRSGRVLNKNQPKTKTASKVIIEEHEDEPADNLSPEIPLQDVIIPKQKESESQPNTQPQVPKEPPFPERLLIEKPVIQSEFDIMTELRNVCVKIPLLQAIKDVPIYAKTIKELCIKKPGRKQKDPPTIHLVGQLSNYISETPKIVKYANPGNPIVSVTINNVSIGNTLVDLGAAINIMTSNTVELLQLDQLLRPTPTVLELADRTTIKPAGVLDDILVTLASWEYPVDFMIIHSKDPTKGHPIILGRPWLATANAFIGCRGGDMFISNGISSQKLTLFPPARPVTEELCWLKCPYFENEDEESLFSVDEIHALQEPTEDDILSQFLSVTENVEFPQTYLQYDQIFREDFQERSDLFSSFSPSMVFTVSEHSGPYTIPVELSPGRCLYINSELSTSQQEQLTKLLKEQSGAFAWEYTDMKGIHPDTCIHHIYIQPGMTPVRQPQRRMNPILKDFVKEELQKLLNVGFIYPISDSKWVSPLVVVPKKLTGKWRMCVDFRELNKATLKDYFPLPFIDQVLDTLAGKRYFSFLDGYSGYNQIQIAPEDQDKTTFTCPWGTYAYKVLPFGLCNAPATFQRAVLGVFADLIHDCVEVYMDDFTVYGNTFEEALSNLEKVLIRCQESNLSLSHEKCKMLLTEGIVLGHHLSAEGIKVDPAKIEVIVNLPSPKTQKDVRSFLGHAGYYRRFIENFTKVASPMFKLLTKDTEFCWDDNCQCAFEELKAKLSMAPVLRGPNWSLPFHISTDASDTALGGVLGQKEEPTELCNLLYQQELDPP
jgi:hypothetical protein